MASAGESATQALTMTLAGCGGSVMRTFRDAKVMAKALRAEMPDLSHSRALEILAQEFGFDNWNILAAKIDPAEQSRIEPAFERGLPRWAG
jgi:hypothetical protein